MKVGVFDSGIGGLTILSSCVKVVNATYYYYGDNENAPYGTKSEGEITALARKAFDEFMKIGVEVVIIACNTVTAVCIDRFRKEYPFYIVGTEPALSLAYGKCLLIATEATLSSDRLNILIERYSALQVVKYAPKRLVEEIEEKIFSLNEVDLSFMQNREEDCVVLGCTHYSWVKNRIETYLPAFDGAEGVAKRLLAYTLNRRGIQGSQTTSFQNSGKFNHCCFEKEVIKMDKEELFLKMGKNSTIFYLGSGFRRNFAICKQMFV